MSEVDELAAELLKACDALSTVAKTLDRLNHFEEWLTLRSQWLKSHGIQVEALAGESKTILDHYLAARYGRPQ